MCTCTCTCACQLPSVLVHDVPGDTLVGGGDGRVDLYQQQSDDGCHVELVVPTRVLNVTILQCICVCVCVHVHEHVSVHYYNIAHLYFNPCRNSVCKVHVHVHI